MDIVLSTGFEGLTMARVAKRLDLTAGALYRYFSSKEVLVAELEARAITELHALINSKRKKWTSALQRTVDSDQWGLHELVAVGQFYEGLLTQRPRLFRLVSKTLADPLVLVTDEQAAAKVAVALGGLLGCVTEMFEDAQAQGSLQPGRAEERTAVFWSAHHGTLQTDKLGRFSTTLRATHLAPALRRALLLGWGAKEQSIQAAEDWVRKKENTK